MPLYRWRRVAVVPKGHALTASRRPLSLADLAHQPLIGYESPLGSHASATAAFARAGLPAQFAYTAHDTEVIKAYVRAGLGVGLVAEMTSGDGDLVQLPIDGLPPCETYAIFPRDRVARDYAIDFLANLAPHIRRRDLVRSLDPGSNAPPAPALPWSDWLRLTTGPGLDQPPVANWQAA